MKASHLRNDLRTTGKYRLFGPEGARNQRQQSLPDGFALEIVHLALLNSLGGQPDEIVLIEPFINRGQLHAVGRVKPFKLPGPEMTRETGRLYIRMERGQVSQEYNVRLPTACRGCLLDAHRRGRYSVSLKNV